MCEQLRKQSCEHRESRAAARRRSEPRRSFLCERRRRRRVQSAMCEQLRNKAASIGNRAPPHGGGASRGVLSSASDDDGGGFRARCASSLENKAASIGNRAPPYALRSAQFPDGLHRLQPMQSACNQRARRFRCRQGAAGGVRRQLLNALWVLSSPRSTSDSTASAARPISTSTSSRALAGKLLSRKSAGSCRPGGRPTPMRTR